MPVCAGPIGPGGQYDACQTPNDCGAALNCIDTGDALFEFCCLAWCVTSSDCPAGSLCEQLATPVYANGVLYGVCYDGLGGCL